MRARQLKRLYLILACACFSVGALAESRCKPIVSKGADGRIHVTHCNGPEGIIPSPAADDPSTPESSASYPAASAAYDEYLKAFYEYNTDALKNRHDVFSWQYYSTIVIFLLVIMLVVAGVVFAALQFRHGMRRKNQNVDTIELSLGSLKVSSSTMGIIVLTLSMGFFYLYLKFVYPVTIVTDSSPPPSATAPPR